MNFLSTVLKGVSNPFIREIAHGVAGAIKGQKGADVVDRGFKLFDQLKSAFEQFAHPSKTGTAKSGGSLKDPRVAMQQTIASNQSASTASGGAVGSSKSADTVSSSDSNSQVSGLVHNALGGGLGLSSFQEGMLKDSGFPPDSNEYKQAKLQMIMSNYTNMVQMLSNISKMMSDMQKGIIQNIRS